VRVLEVCFKYPPDIGGIQLHAQGLAEFLASKSDDVVVLTTGEKASPQSSRIAVRRFPADLSILQADISPKLLRAIFSETPDADVVHLHMNFHFADLATALACALARVPLVITYHNDPVPPTVAAKFASLLHTLFFLLPTLAAARSIIVTTQPYAETSWRLRLVRDKWRVIPLGVDTEFFHPVAESRVRGRIVFLGRLDNSSYERKGVETLLEALHRVPQTLDWHLLVVGPLLGDTRQRLTTAVRRRNLEGSVSVLDEVARETIPGILESAQVCVLPARHRGEAFGIPIIEALACGCTPVVPDLPGPASIAPAFAVTFKPGDSTDLARALVWALGREVAWADATARYDFVSRNYSMTRTLDCTRRLLLELIRTEAANTNEADSVRRI